MDQQEKKREILVTRLITGEHVIYEHERHQAGMQTYKVTWKDPLFISTERNPENGQALIYFRLYIMYADLRRVDPPHPWQQIVTYEPAKDIIDARDQFLENYQFERESQRQEKQGKGPRKDPGGNLTLLQ